MIDQNILYAECPCGSGKKFKFCCYPSVRADLPHNPTRAEVVDVIRQHAHSEKLVEISHKKGALDLDRFHMLIKRGLNYLHSGEYQNAEEQFLQVKEEFGFLPTAYNNLALCALVQGDLKKAEDVISEAIRKFPEENPFGMAIHADIKYIKGDIIGAREIISRVENITPPTVDQAVRVCESMAHFKDHERIERYLAKYGYVDNPEAAFFYGIALANLGREHEAAKALRIALKCSMSHYVKDILDKIIASEKADTICGDWMYFTPENFMIFSGLLQNMHDGGEAQVDLAAEAYAELLEIEANSGVFDIKQVIKALNGLVSKRSERMLDALRSDESRPRDIRKAAEKAYLKMFGRNDLGQKLQEIPDGQFRKVQITEEAATNAPLEPAYEESYFKALKIIQNPFSKKSALNKAVRLLEDLYDKIPDNLAVCNNYASALSLVGRVEESIAVIKNCFANHPEYVFGAANYLSTLVFNGKIAEAKAMHDNYSLPQRIHPDAYLAWCRAELRYYSLIGEMGYIQNVEKTIKMIKENFKK
jgi:tetratricopeptide (TPR) repeat protein